MGLKYAPFSFLEDPRICMHLKVVWEKEWSFSPSNLYSFDMNWIRLVP